MVYHITTVKSMSKMALEALVPILRPLIRSPRAAEEQKTFTSENRLPTRKQNMLSMHERRKSVSSASVIWYIVLFRQNRTDRPVGRNNHRFSCSSAKP